MKAGRQFTTATLKAKDGDYTQFWNIVAFSEPVQAELMRLTAGGVVAVLGALKAELYDRDGEIDMSFGIIADYVLRLRQPRQKREKDTTWPPSSIVPSKRVPF